MSIRPTCLRTRLLLAALCTVPCVASLGAAASWWSGGPELGGPADLGETGVSQTVVGAYVVGRVTDSVGRPLSGAEIGVVGYPPMPGMVHEELGVVTWDDEVDIAPETAYSLATGAPLPRWMETGEQKY